MRHLAILALIALSACGSTGPAEPKIVIQEVKVPVAVSCVSKDFKDRPATPDTDEALKAAPIDQFVQLLLAGRTIRDAWIPTAQKQIDICKAAGGDLQKMQTAPSLTGEQADGAQTPR